MGFKSEIEDYGIKMQLALVAFVAGTVFLLVASSVGYFAYSEHLPWLLGITQAQSDRVSLVRAGVTFGGAVAGVLLAYLAVRLLDNLARNG